MANRFFISPKMLKIKRKMVKFEKEELVIKVPTPGYCGATEYWRDLSCSLLNLLYQHDFEFEFAEDFKVLFDFLECLLPEFELAKLMDADFVG